MSAVVPVVDVGREARIARERVGVVEEVRRWIGTPFHHGARVFGAGVDCSQLLVAVYADALGLVPPVTLRYYPPDWFLHHDEERIELELMRHARRVPTPLVGDIATFRYGRTTSHSGIVVQAGEHPRVVHAFAGFGVIESEVEPHHHLYARLRGWWTLARWRSLPSPPTAERAP